MSIINWQYINSMNIKISNSSQITLSHVAMLISDIAEYEHIVFVGERTWQSFDHFGMW